MLRKTDASSECAGDVLIVANVDRSALTARFHVPGLKCTRGIPGRPFEDEGRQQQQHFNPIQVMFEQGRTLPCNASSPTFEDDLEEYGVHMYLQTNRHVLVHTILKLGNVAWCSALQRSANKQSCGHGLM